MSLKVNLSEYRKGMKEEGRITVIVILVLIVIDGVRDEELWGLTMDPAVVFRQSRIGVFLQNLSDLSALCER